MKGGNWRFKAVEGYEREGKGLKGEKMRVKEGEKGWKGVKWANRE